eukprot:6994418-Prymnesium_polylepis.1
MSARRELQRLPVRVRSVLCARAGGAALWWERLEHATLEDVQARRLLMHDRVGRPGQHRLRALDGTLDLV